MTGRFIAAALQREIGRFCQSSCFCRRRQQQQQRDKSLHACLERRPRRRRRPRSLSILPGKQTLTKSNKMSSTPSTVNVRVKVRPVVLFQIADAYERRSMENHRVIGTLLGSVDKQSIEVTNCFCVPHKEYDERVEADLQYAQDMFELNKKVAPQETLVGWFATGNEITSHSALIHDYYARETKDPIHLTVDTTLMSGKMGMKAYVFVPIGVPGATSGSMFTPIPTEISAFGPEVTGLDLLHKTKHNKMRQVSPDSDLMRVSEGIGKLENMLEVVLEYVDKVLTGAGTPDNAVGRKLLDLVNSVPKMTPDEFEKMINSNMKDLLMVIYLTQLTKTQLQLNEKLTTVSVNQLKEYQKLLPE